MTKAGISRYPLIWPRAVIFDLDGTLADTVEDIAVALNATLSEIDLPPHPPEAVRTMVGGGLAKLLQRALKAHEASLDEAGEQEALARLFALYAQRPVAQSRLYDGVVPLLQTFRAAGIALGICTNKPHSITLDVVQGLGLADLVACVQGGEAGFPKKPDPAVLHHVMRQLGASPAGTVMVGDSAADVGAARAAGLSAVILVAGGYSGLPASELGADMVIEHLGELPQSLALLAERD